MKNGVKKNIKARLLFTIIREAKSENEALTSLQDLLKDIPTLPLLLKWNNRTLLAFVAGKGYLKVLRFLIEEKKVDPNEQFIIKNVNFTALEAAVLNNQINAALYLVEKLERFVVNNNNECIALSLAMTNNQLKVVEKILIRDPKQYAVVTKDKRNTLLHQALFLSSCDDIAIYLIQNGAKNDIFTANDKGKSPYFLALHKAREKVLDVMLEFGANPLSCSYWNEDKEPLKIILSNQKNSKENIIKCFNHLLAAGAGIDRSRLPDEIYTIYDLQNKKDTLGPFLLIAKESNGYKKRWVTKEDELQEYLDNPNWQFKYKQLALAAAYPKLKAEHISKLQKLFSMQIKESLPSSDVSKLNLLSVKQIKNLTNYQLIQQLSTNWSEFFEKANIFRGVLMLTCIPEEDLLQPMQTFFKKLSDLLMFLNHPYVNSVMLKCTEVDKPSNLATLLNNELIFLMRCHMLSRQFYSVVFFEPFYEHLTRLIKNHRKILNSKEYFFAYDALILTQLTAICYLAQFNAKNGLVLYWALEANYICDNMQANDPAGWKEPKINALFVLAIAYVYLGWHKEAHSTLKKGFKLLEFTYQTTSIMGCIENIIAALDNTLHGTEEAIQVLTQCCLILEAYQDKMPETCQQPIVINLLKAKKTLHAAQLLYFINSDLFKALKELGMIIDAIKGTEVFFRLDQTKIPLAHELINFCFTTLPSSIQYDATNTVLRVKLGFLPMRSIAWLKEFKAVLREIISTEKISLIQDFSNLSIQPTSERKVKIKTRPQQVNNVEVNSIPDLKSDIFIQEEKTYDFKHIPDHLSPVPILCKNKYIPEETLFITLPTNEPAFLPFLNYIRNKDSGGSYGVYSISKKGHNEEGVKFDKKRGIETARFKLLGSNGQLRALGQKCQEYKTPQGRTLKLFSFSKVVTKNREKNSP